MITLYFEDGSVAFDNDRFPDGTQRLNLGFPIDKIFWRYENDAELFTIMAIKRHIDNIYPDDPVDLVMPYIPNARMDRVENSQNVFTLKYFVEFINNLKFRYIYVLDAHSTVSLGLLDRVRQLDVNYYIRTAITTCIEKDPGLILFYPDSGAMKRYSKHFSNRLFAYGEKIRDWDTGQITGLQVINADLVEGHDVLIIDDISSRGGTFYHSANALKEVGAKNISLYVTHAEHTMVEGPMYNEDVITKIFTTDSIFQAQWDTRNKVTVLEVDEHAW